MKKNNKLTIKKSLVQNDDYYYRDSEMARPTIDLFVKMNNEKSHQN